MVFLQCVLQKAQQVVTLSVLGREFDEKLKSCLSVMKMLFKVNQKARLVPISEFYNDAGQQIPFRSLAHPSDMQCMC